MNATPEDIDINRLTSKDIGRWVAYTPAGATQVSGLGLIKDFNDIAVVVAFAGRERNRTVEAVPPFTLRFIERPEKGFNFS